MMKRWIKTMLFSLFTLSLLGGVSFLAPVAAQANFWEALQQGTESIAPHLDAPSTALQVQDTAAWVVQKVVDVLFPVILIVGVLVAMFGLYQILTSSDEGKLKSWMHMMIYGVIGILIMYSAKYLTGVVFSDVFKGGVGEAMTTVQWIQMLYDKIAFPFIKIAIYLSLGVLVILMMVRVFSYITAQDDSTKKKAIGVITWTTVGMIFITAAKQIVEAVYGKQETVLNQAATSLDQIGTQILNPKEIPILFTVLNWALGLISFVLLIMILMQTYKMLTKPDDAETFKSLKKNDYVCLVRNDSDRLSLSAFKSLDLKLDKKLTKIWFLTILEYSLAFFKKNDEKQNPSQYRYDAWLRLRYDLWYGEKMWIWWDWSRDFQGLWCVERKLCQNPRKKVWTSCVFGSDFFSLK